MQPYPIIYDGSFIVFWGMSLALGLFVGGLLTFALVAAMILILINHEHAHVKQCIRHYIPIRSLRFTWIGGFLDSDIRYASDVVRVCSAGVINTGMYAFSLVGIVAVIMYFRPVGLNFANNQYLNFLNGITLFAVVLLISNLLPIVYHSKTDGMITTDGWASIWYAELRDEMWNDGVHDALDHMKCLQCPVYLHRVMKGSDN